MAITAAQYQSMRLAFRIMLSVEGVGPTDSDVLSFSSQLFADSSGAAALSTARNFLATEVLRTVLSAAIAPTDSNVSDFLTQLATDSSGATPMGLTTRYRSMRNALRAAMSGGGLNPSDADVLSYFAPFASINFASLFTPGQLLLSVQSDLGVTLATGVSAWADQSGNGNNFAQAGGTQQPALSAGVNGRPGLLFDGSNDELDNASLIWPASVSLRFVFRNVGYAPSTAILGPNTNATGPIVYQVGASPNIRQFCVGDGALINGGAPLGTWVRARALFNNATTDYLRLGSVVSTGVNSGAGRAGSGMRLAFSAWAGFVNFANLELLQMAVLSAEPTAPQDAAYDTAVAAMYGATVGL